MHPTSTQAPSGQRSPATATCAPNATATRAARSPPEPHTDHEQVDVVGAQAVCVSHDRRATIAPTVTPPLFFAIELDQFGLGIPTAKRLRAAHARVWRLIGRRFIRTLSRGELDSLGVVDLLCDVTRLAFRWDESAPAPARLYHWIELAAAIEADAIGKVLAPIGLRLRGGRTVYEALEPSTAAACGLCKAVRADPLRWGGLSPDALAALRTLSVGAARAMPDEVVATLRGLLSAPERDTAITAAGQLARLLPKARAADREKFAAMVPFAWRHPDARVARAALGCAAALGNAATEESLEAWVDAIDRFRDDHLALRELAPLSKVAARSLALAAALPAWLRSSSPNARRVASLQLKDALKAPPEKWTPALKAAFDALSDASMEKLEVEYAPLLLRHFDLLTEGLARSLGQLLATVDLDRFEVTPDLFAQQRKHPELSAVCVRALLHPITARRSYALAQASWRYLSDEALAGHIALVFDAMAQADARVATELLDHVDDVLCAYLATDRSANRRLAARLLAPGTSAERVAAIAAKLMPTWSMGQRDERLFVVRTFVAHGWASALVTAFRGFTAAPTDEGKAAAHVGLGLSWAMQQAGAWAEGGEVAGLAAGVAPTNVRPNLLYNQACGYAMCGDGEAAARVLAEAVALDPKQADDARADADITPVRGHPAMVALLGAAAVAHDG
jgi:hypothetical protein